jgi:hypothetical protein
MVEMRALSTSWVGSLLSYSCLRKFLFFYIGAPTRCSLDTILEAFGAGRGLEPPPARSSLASLPTGLPCLHESEGIRFNPSSISESSAVGEKYAFSNNGTRRNCLQILDLKSSFKIKEINFYDSYRGQAIYTRELSNGYEIGSLLLMGPKRPISCDGNVGVEIFGLVSVDIIK